MLARFSRLLTATLIAGCIASPVAFASGVNPEAAPARLRTRNVRLIDAVESVRIGSTKTVIKIKNGRRVRPIVIDYGELLQTGVLGASKTKGHSRSGAGGTPSVDWLPKGLTLGQLAAAMLGLTIASRTLRVVRQLVPSRRR